MSNATSRRRVLTCLRSSWEETHAAMCACIETAMLLWTYEQEYRRFADACVRLAAVVRQLDAFPDLLPPAWWRWLCDGWQVYNPDQPDQLKYLADTIHTLRSLPGAWQSTAAVRVGCRRCPSPLPSPNPPFSVDPGPPAPQDVPGQAASRDSLPAVSRRG
jgi:hypothetical protein